MIEEKKPYKSIYSRYIKRVLDLLFAVLLLVLLIPIIFIISIVILCTMGWPIIYKGKRCGYKEKVFSIYKFRTMVKNAEQIGGGTSAFDDTRITPVGKLLRKTKLDEIPQLINIIKGEMSFVGPRPELLKYTNLYNPLEKEILMVKPGITDYSSIEFINLDEIVGSENADENYERYVLPKKNRLRLEYVTHVAFKTDLKILYATIFKVFYKIVRYMKSVR